MGVRGPRSFDDNAKRPPQPGRQRLRSIENPHHLLHPISLRSLQTIVAYCCPLLSFRGAGFFVTLNNARWRRWIAPSRHVWRCSSTA